MANILEKTNQVLLALSFLDEIHENQRLSDDLGFDSLGMVDVVLSLEEAFGIEINIDDLDPANFTLVSDVYALMEKYAGVMACAV
mgnify:CR=1 FL=1